MRIHIKIYGNVQGVFFRSSAKDAAEKLGLVGWIRNNPDGMVETLAQGNKKDLNQFLEWCKKGPAFAKIEKVEVKWDGISGDYKSFEIIR